MKIGRVTGAVVCTIKVDSLEGTTLLLVQPLDEEGNPRGNPLIACDRVQAGEGDVVIYEGGREAALTLKNWYNPADAAVIGIVDSIQGEIS